MGGAPRPRGRCPLPHGQAVGSGLAPPAGGLCRVALPTVALRATAGPQQGAQLGAPAVWHGKNPPFRSVCPRSRRHGAGSLIFVLVVAYGNAQRHAHKNRGSLVAVVRSTPCATPFSTPCRCAGLGSGFTPAHSSGRPCA
jgi:hypothetical protein